MPRQGHLSKNETSGLKIFKVVFKALVMFLVFSTISSSESDSLNILFQFF